MTKNRLEAFSGGVLAIIITIMVLEIKVPHGTEWDALKPLIPVFLSYVISFLLVGSGILLSNLHLRFWLSLVPFATGWMGEDENHFEPNSIILYASILVMCGIAYGILQNEILKTMDHQSEIVIALKKQGKKTIMSILLVLLAIPFSFVHPVISGLMFFLQSAIWLISNKNIERALHD